MNAKNRLIGWLVSYADNKLGMSHEIRVGRTLISSNGNGKENGAIMLKEKSIAAPHMAVRANQKHEVHIQDIFTESGTYLSRADGKKEEKIHGNVSLKHGDWIRIGNSTRFQVCLIDRPAK